jgi:hypothetical protein
MYSGIIKVNRNSILYIPKLYSPNSNKQARGITFFQGYSRRQFFMSVSGYPQPLYPYPSISDPWTTFFFSVFDLHFLLYVRTTNARPGMGETQNFISKIRNSKLVKFSKLETRNSKLQNYYRFYLKINISTLKNNTLYVP